MKFSKKRVCGNCKAHPFDSYSSSCQLGYEVRYEEVIRGMLVKYFPEEPCYKPTTNADFVSLITAKNNL